MNLPLARLIAISALLAAGSAASSASEAAPVGVLVDPTRPPSAQGAVPGAEKNAQNRTVQSVLIGPGRSVAVIDGEMVRVGSRLGEARVVRIDESGVVLRNGARMEILRLLPDAARTGAGTSRHNKKEERAK